MTRFSSLRPLAVLLVAASVLTSSTRASAGDRPYSLQGTARFVSATDFVGSGYATHLGPYNEVGSASFSPTDDPGILLVDAQVILTASNGDQLYETISGRLNGATGVITATVTYVGGTGRFEDAVGSATLSGQFLPDGTISVTVKGTIDY